MEIRKCKRCGFILGTRPNLTDVDGVCTPCLHAELKKNINWNERQEWLTQYIDENGGVDNMTVLLVYPEEKIRIGL